MTPETSYVYDAHAYRSFFEHEFTYLNGFRRNVGRYAGEVAMIDPLTDRQWTYAELGSAVDELAAGLADRGVTDGDVVGYQLLNGPEFAQLYLATQAAGAVGSPVNFRLAAGETAVILDISRPKVYVYDASIGAMVGEAIALADHTPELLVGVGDGRLVPGSIRFDDLPVTGGAAPTVARGVFDETTRLYTSGTTGMPKAVPMNSAIEIFSAHDVIMHFPLSPDDRTLNMTPWFHRGGLYCAGPNPSFYLGSSVVPMRTFDPELTLDWVEKYRLTFLIGAPTNLAMLAGAQSANPRDLSSLRGIVTMGAPLEREAALRYQQVLTRGSSTATAAPRASGTPSCVPATCPITPAPPAAPASTTTSAWSASTTTAIWRARMRSSPATVKKSARSSFGRPNARPPTTTPHSRRGRSTTGAGCTSATWPPGIRASSSPSWDARTTCSCPAARTSTRSRSRRR